MLIGAESRYLTLNDGTDQEILMTAFSNDLSFVVNTRNGSFGEEVVQSLLDSIQSFKQGFYSKKQTMVDTKGYGIKRKIMISKLEGIEKEWKRLDFNITKQGIPDWIEEEINDLLKPSYTEWLELPELPSYNTLAMTM